MAADKHSLADTWRLTQAIMCDGELSDAAKVVAVRLLGYRNGKTGRCNPKRATIAASLGKSPRRLSDLLTELRDCDWITVEPVSAGGHWSFTFNEERSAGCEDVCDGASPLARSGYTPLAENDYPPSQKLLGVWSDLATPIRTGEGTGEGKAGLASVPACTSAPAPARGGAVTGITDDELQADLLACLPAGWSIGRKHLPAIRKLLDDGVSLQEVILPAIEAEAARAHREGRKIGSWLSFVEVIQAADKRAKRQAEAAHPKDKVGEMSLDFWDQVVRSYRPGGEWRLDHRTYAPDNRKTCIPASILRKHGYAIPQGHPEFEPSDAVSPASQAKIA